MTRYTNRRLLYFILRWDRQTDGRTPDRYITLPLDAATRGSMRSGQRTFLPDNKENRHTFKSGPAYDCECHVVKLSAGILTHLLCYFKNLDTLPCTNYGNIDIIS